MSWIFVEPGDVWSFRDGRPMLGGGGHITRSVFPPSPQTVQGALRSLLLGRSDVGWDAFREQSTDEARTLGKIIGHPGQGGRPASLGAFAMAGPFLAREDEKVVRYAPMPADVRQIKGDERAFVTLRPTRKRRFAADWPAPGLEPLWPETEDDVQSVEEPKWLGNGALDNYLLGKRFDALGASELFDREARLGIALDYERRRPIDGMLYQIEFLRPREGVGLLVWVGDGLGLPAEGTLRLGGEGRAGRYRTLKDQQVAAKAGLEKAVERLKVLFLTPAYFDGGWQPADGNSGWSQMLGGPVRLVSASLGRPQRLGGWDMAARGGRGWHKPINAYVPAGSVYYFETSEALSPPGGSVTHTPAGEPLPLDRIGFGQIAVGTWDWLD